MKPRLRLGLPVLIILSLLAVVLPISPVSANGEIITYIIPVFEDTTLTSDMTFDGGGYVIVVDNITFDLNGHTLTNLSPSAGGPAGILMMNRTGVTIKNGTIVGFTNGILIFNGNGNTIDSIAANNSLWNGINLLDNSDNNTVINCAAGNVIGSDGYYSNGLFINNGSDFNVIQNFSATGNGNGIFIGGGGDLYTMLCQITTR